MFNALYVEDDVASRHVFQMIQRLNPELLSLVMLDNSYQFEDQLLQLDPRPNLIMLDIHVKPYSGFDMLKMVRQHSEYDTVPVVAVTASVMNEEIDLLQKAGFQGVLSKPLNMEEFPQLIQRIMRGEKVWYVW